MVGKYDKINDGIMDSGLTEHIVHKFESLENGARTTREAPVMIPNGDNIPSLWEQNHEVLYIPNFNCNLLFISRLSKELQCAVSFFLNIYVMQGLHLKKLIGTGECIRGLYRIGMTTQ